MKKQIASIFSLAALLCCAAAGCAAVPALEGKKVLVVYFSMPETAKTRNLSREEENSLIVVNGQALGNTQYAAQLIQKETGGDIFRLTPQRAYPTEHRTLVALARREKDQNARPPLASLPEKLDSYDVVFIGYPNWWADMPMVLYTFLESVNLQGKTIVPFVTHGGSGFSGSIGAIARLQPKARVLSGGYSVYRDDMEDCAEDVPAWLKKLNFNALY